MGSKEAILTPRSSALSSSSTSRRVDARSEAGEAGDFLADLRAFGYPDAPDETLLAAFRLRFHPWATGGLNPYDCALAAGLRDF